MGSFARNGRELRSLLQASLLNVATAEITHTSVLKRNYFAVTGSFLKHMYFLARM